MTPKSLVGLGAVTLVAVVAAAYSVNSRHAAAPVMQDPVPAVAGLEDRVNSVDRLVVKTADGAFTLQRTGATWAMPEKNGYRVDAERVRNVLVQLSQLRLAEGKTRLPERYARLEVEDVTAEDAKSAQVTALDASGAVLADLIVGKAKSDLGGGLSGRYLRKPGEEQAWLAQGALDLRKAPADWLVKDIVDIDEGRVRRVAVTSAAGETVVVEREAPDKAFTLKGVPEGKTVKAGELSGFGSALDGLELTDVAARDGRPLPEEKTAEAVVDTFDGLRVKLAIEETEEGIFAHFGAEAFAADGGEAAKSDALEAARKEAEAINARVGDWVYKVPDHKLRPLLKPAADLIEG